MKHASILTVLTLLVLGLNRFTFGQLINKTLGTLDITSLLLARAGIFVENRTTTDIFLTDQKDPSAYLGSNTLISVCRLVNNATKGAPGYDVGIHECISNNECLDHLACVEYRCVDPCIGVCGSNSSCTATRHYPACYCKEGFSGNPVLGCILQVTQKCSSDNDCAVNHACSEYKCVDPCQWHLCRSSPKGVCNTINHRPICTCIDGTSTDGCELNVISRTPQIPEAVKKFQIGKKLVTWKNALAECDSLNLTMATVTSQIEQNELVNMAKQIIPAENIWLSGTIDETGEYFYWKPTGNTITYSFWDTAEPVMDEMQRCIGVGKDGIKWFSAPCRYVMFFACEYYLS